MVRNTKQEPFREFTQVNNKQSDTKFSARTIELKTSLQGADRATANVEQNRARFKIETETIS